MSHLDTPGATRKGILCAGHAELSRVSETKDAKGS